MGCDIHIFIEDLRVIGKPTLTACLKNLFFGFNVGVEYNIKIDEFEFDLMLLTGRDYGFFGYLAGVRGGGGYAKGLPSEMSSELLAEFDDDTDYYYHNHSWDMLADFIIKWHEVRVVPIVGITHEGLKEALKQYRVVYAFDS